MSRRARFVGAYLFQNFLRPLIVRSFALFPRADHSLGYGVIGECGYASESGIVLTYDGERLRERRQNTRLHLDGPHFLQTASRESYQRDLHACGLVRGGF